MPKVRRSRPKRLPYKQKRDGDINPFITAAGAAAGYKAAGAISERGRQKRALRAVSKKYGELVPKVQREGDAWSTRLSDSAANEKGAAATYKYFKGGSPRIKQETYNNMKRAMEGGMTSKEAAKFVGLNREEKGILSTRRSMTKAYRGAQTPKQMLDLAVKERRIGYGESRASKRSRVAGGISGAALTALAQAVAAELRKKR